MRISLSHRHPGTWWSVAVCAAVLLVLATAASASAGTTTATERAGCDDELHRISLGSPVAADDAAHLTAQAVEAGSDSFALASWQVGEGVELTEVRVVTAAGETSVLPPAATGTVEQVHTLVFCGARDGATGTAVPPTSDDTEVPATAVLASAERASTTTAEPQGSRAFEVLAAALALLSIGLTAAGRSGRGLHGRIAP
jgi:hypothetical protein